MSNVLTTLLDRHIVWTEGRLSAFRECAAAAHDAATPTLPTPIAQAPLTVTIQTRLPDMTLFANFVSAAQCKELIVRAHAKLVPSAVIDNATGLPVPHAARTSNGASFARGETPLIAELERQISELTGVPVEHGEGFQILRYEVGQEYKPHQDFFDPNSPGSQTIVDTTGQRIGTFLIYLNTPEQGGETIFPDAGITVAAQQGSALLFRYAKADATSQALHGGAPVQAGVKWVATKWMRDRPYGIK